MQKSTPEAIREQMRHYKHFWVVENAESKIIGFQAVSAPRFISRPAGKHKFFGPLADVARRVLSDASFLYMSQIAVHPDYRGQGLASEVQRLALERYDDYPLIAHVAICTQADFDAWDGNPSTFQPRTNNVASHRFHQKLGYVPVAWTSDLRGTTQYNSGLTASNDATPILGVLYMRLPGMTASSDAYQDPVQAVLAAPCTLGECDSAAWKNPFPKSWPLKESDLDEMLGRVLAPGAARLLPAYDVLVRGPQEELQHMMR